MTLGAPGKLVDAGFLLGVDAAEDLAVGDGVELVEGNLHGLLAGFGDWALGLTSKRRRKCVNARGRRPGTTPC